MMNDQQIQAHVAQKCQKRSLLEKLIDQKHELQSPYNTAQLDHYLNAIHEKQEDRNNTLKNTQKKVQPKTEEPIQTNNEGRIYYFLRYLRYDNIYRNNQKNSQTIDDTPNDTLKDRRYKRPSPTIARYLEQFQKPSKRTKIQERKDEEIKITSKQFYSMMDKMESSKNLSQSLKAIKKWRDKKLQKSKCVIIRQTLNNNVVITHNVNATIRTMIKNGIQTVEDEKKKRIKNDPKWRGWFIGNKQQTNQINQSPQQNKKIETNFNIQKLFLFIKTSGLSLKDWQLILKQEQIIVSVANNSKLGKTKHFNSNQQRQSKHDRSKNNIKATQDQQIQKHQLPQQKYLNEEKGQFMDDDQKNQNVKTDNKNQSIYVFNITKNSSHHQKQQDQTNVLKTQLRRQTKQSIPSDSLSSNKLNQLLFQNILKKIKTPSKQQEKFLINLGRQLQIIVRQSFSRKILRCLDPKDINYIGNQVVQINDQEYKKILRYLDPKDTKYIGNKQSQIDNQEVQNDNQEIKIKKLAVQIKKLEAQFGKYLNDQLAIKKLQMLSKYYEQLQKSSFVSKTYSKLWRLIQQSIQDIINQIIRYNQERRE